MSICWYEDDELKIVFSETPKVIMRYSNRKSAKDEILNIYKKPFLNLLEFSVELYDFILNEDYKFTIPAGYTWDGASIPRIFWRLIGSKTDNRFLIPSLIHDVLCENHEYIDNDRYFSTIVFERLLFVSGLNPVSRWAIKHCVDNYQKFCNWEK